ncbi:hypothetical protein HC891_27355 [Candidatus Gracilibacteria bacterium]|nr:hypothetical protein [Candidatus Gracilibacteria bacterium]
MNYNGRQVQWFERARLEYFPEFNGTPYVVQSGLAGREFTDGRDFPPQQFFVSTPELQYFPETGHAIGGLFLNFWRANGGMAVFGFPISEEFDEALPDGRTLRVQYFERARMEYHPELAGTSSEIQLGHLARALYLNEARPVGVPIAPTMVPMPGGFKIQHSEGVRPRSRTVCCAHTGNETIKNNGNGIRRCTMTWATSQQCNPSFSQLPAVGMTMTWRARYMRT